MSDRRFMGNDYNRHQPVPGCAVFAQSPVVWWASTAAAFPDCCTSNFDQLRDSGPRRIN